MLLRQLYRLCRQLFRFEIIHVNTAQTALFGFHQECGFAVVDDAARQGLFCQLVQAGERQVFTQLFADLLVNRAPLPAGRQGYAG